MIFYYSYLALGAFLISLLGTRITIQTLRDKAFLQDIPNARSNHKRAVPRGGGIAVIFTLVIFLMIMDASYWLIAGTLLLAAISLVDDWISLGPATRLIVQALAVLLALTDIQIPVIEAYLPLWLTKALIFLCWMWFINLFNFMDGIDGLATGEAISIAGGIVCISALLGTFTDTLSLHSLIVFGAAFGFMWWNWHPAKIFLGDVGSIPLGYVLAYLLLMLAGNGYVFAALILPAYFVADATITLVRRAIRREKIWEAHSSHFYQQAVRSGMSHTMVVESVLGVNIVLVALAALVSLEPSLGWLYLSIAYGMVTAVLLFVFADGKKAKTPPPGHKGT